MDERIDILTTLYIAEQTFDSGDLEQNIQTWSDEVLIETPFGSADSLESYKDWFNGFYAQTSANGGTRHYVHNPIVHINGDRAEIIAYLSIINASTGGFLGSARIHEKLKKTNAGWKFTYRSVKSDQDLSKTTSEKVRDIYCANSITTLHRNTANCSAECSSVPASGELGR